MKIDEEFRKKILKELDERNAKRVDFNVVCELYGEFKRL